MQNKYAFHIIHTSHLVNTLSFFILVTSAWNRTSNPIL